MCRGVVSRYETQGRDVFNWPRQECDSFAARAVGKRHVAKLKRRGDMAWLWAKSVEARLGQYPCGNRPGDRVAGTSAIAGAQCLRLSQFVAAPTAAGPFAVGDLPVGDAAAEGIEDNCAVVGRGGTFEQRI
jgi:hypothetical protein